MITLLLTAALAWTPTEAEQKLVAALSARDGAPPCAVVEALVPDPVVSLGRVVDNVKMPPWAPMHAATCLIERHAEAVEPDLERWVTEPGMRGLAKLVFNRLAIIESERAVRLARAGLNGPYATDASTAIRRDDLPEFTRLLPVE